MSNLVKTFEVRTSSNSNFVSSLVFYFGASYAEQSRNYSSLRLSVCLSLFASVHATKKNKKTTDQKLM